MASRDAGYFPKLENRQARPGVDIGDVRLAGGPQRDKGACIIMQISLRLVGARSPQAAKAARSAIFDLYAPLGFVAW